MAEARATPDTALRDDVRMLGELLGDTLRAHEGAALFDLVEKVRASAKQARLGGAGQAAALTEGLATIPTAMVLPLARAFAHFLALANVAEQHHRGRVAASHERPLFAVIERAKAAGLDHRAIVEAISSQEIELVLTAHPTQVVRRTVR
jgi:phosphoenolpyruvate carboxylase